MTEIKIKILEMTKGTGLETKFFIAEQCKSYAIIRYSVRENDFQKKTNYTGKIIPNEFFVKV